MTNVYQVCTNGSRCSVAAETVEISNDAVTFKTAGEVVCFVPLSRLEYLLRTEVKEKVNSDPTSLLIPLNQESPLVS